MQIRTLLHTFLLTGLACLTIPVSAQNQCPKISCDCMKLPVEPWQSICANYEKKIKQACAKNGGEPTTYCALHGPDATPLPLAISVPAVEVIPVEDIAETNRRIASMYWSVRTDVDLALEQVEKGQHVRAQQIIKVVEANIQNLFENQHQVVVSWVSYEEEKNAIKAWRDYSSDTENMAEYIEKRAADLWKRFEQAEDKTVKKVNRVLSHKLLRLAGEVYEQAAYAYDGGVQYEESAKVWSKAAGLTKLLIEQKQSLGASQQGIEYFRYQAAARLHRASYEWLMEEQMRDAKNSLQESQPYMKEPRSVDPLLAEEEE